MKCKICGSEKCVIDYKGKIRTGSSKNEHTNEDVEIWKCCKCGVRFHNYHLPDEYYESDDYWTSIIGGGSISKNMFKDPIKDGEIEH